MTAPSTDALAEQWHGDAVGSPESPEDEEHRKCLIKTLAQYTGGQARAAEALGLDRWCNRHRAPGIAAMVAWLWRSLFPSFRSPRKRRRD
jgi:hypothetical protein